MARFSHPATDGSRLSSSDFFHVSTLPVDERALVAAGRHFRARSSKPRRGRFETPTALAAPREVHAAGDELDITWLPPPPSPPAFANDSVGYSYPIVNTLPNKNC